MKFTLQDMVQQVHGEVDRRVKLAQAGLSEASPENKNTNKTSLSNPATAPDRNEESIGNEKTASAFVEKLASAVDYCNKNFLKMANEGAGTGANATETNLSAPVGGTQSEETGQATPKNVPSTSPGSDSKSPGQTNPQTAMATDINTVPGGSEDWSNKDVLKQASAVLRKALQKKAGVNKNISKVARVLKIAEDAINPASIGAGKDVPPDSSQAEEGVPSQPSETTTQKRLIGSNDAAINYKKSDAKAVPKERMGEVLSEPAQRKSTDPVLHNNLDATGEAGVKISHVKAAAARAFLRKVAQEGMGEDASPEEKERAAKLQAILAAKEEENQEKASMGGMGMDGGGAGAAGGVGGGASMPVGGGF